MFQVYLHQLSRDERSKVIKLAEKHCKQMMDMIYRKKIAYFQSGGDDDWKHILERSYPKDPPEVSLAKTGLYQFCHTHSTRLFSP